jgi:L-glyceraldehyde 3-phosphate reductase
MLTDRYLAGIPKGARATQGKSFGPELLTDQNVANVRALHGIAEARGQSLAQMAIAWVLRDPRVTSALVGASSVAQLEDTLTALDGPAFSDEELVAIDGHAVEGGVNLWTESSLA